ncbi:hypothetical protein FA04_14520 [Ensifer adhaerens]|uniref:Tail fiber domain-containing protein n=1 Tax=Ensifer adhaerens TaxID=106592 RepID=A0ABY8HCJ0_ENSAD|nr:tail fiber domain-containing protein [Ensifer adhaerens]ANK73726.1 hypothetical protein FA04_14520 [Ensifer adhaerens]KDP70312.1 hypothetical protein FA04_29195 [Ensifer adhaerens]WFP89809.1 tail fiber domain-containing protein [Ensifer adhaerens]
MPKNTVRDWDSTAADNTDIAGIGIQGTNQVNNFDNALRTLMAQIADVDGGVAPVNDTWSFCDPADPTKIFRFDAGGIGAATTRVVTIPNANLTLVGADTTQTLTNKTFTDNVTKFADNADATKLAQFECSGITTATTRTYTLPDASGTLALLGLAQAWSATQTFSANPAISNSSPVLSLTDTDTSAVSQLSAASSVGSVALNADSTSVGSAPQVILQVRNTNKLSIGETTATFSVDMSAPTLKSSTTVLSSGLSAPTDFAVSSTAGHFLGDNASASGFSRGGGPAAAIQRNTSNGTALLWFRATTQVGDVSVTATATTYNTTSDGRLKSNQVPLESFVDPGAVIDALQPKKYVWNHVPGDIEGVGFIAQEVAKILPECVNVGDSDSSKRPGDEGFEQWSGSWTPMIPYLVAEIKSLRARIAALESA